MQTQNNPKGSDTWQKVGLDYPKMTTPLHTHSLRMTLLLARQPREGAFRGRVRPTWGRTAAGKVFPTRERYGLALWFSWGVHRSPGHQGRQRPQAGWRAAAEALAEERAGGGAAPGAWGSLAGAAGAAGGRWKW